MKIKNKLDVYEIITNKVIDMLEKEIVPWRNPCHVYSQCNLITKKPYRGINSFMLQCSDYKSPYWATFKQINQLGGTIKKGEKGYMIVYWKIIEKKSNKKDSDEVKKIPLLRYYTVFNVDQTEGIMEHNIPVLESNVNKLDTVDKAENIIDGFIDKPKIEFIENKNRGASYVLQDDTVYMPSKTRFETIEDYYCTLFHELVHSTGHEKRLNRGLHNNKFGNKEYSKEELVAEMGSSFLCNFCQIDNSTINSSVRYIKSWIEVFKNDKKILIQASSKAQKAVDFIVGNKYNDIEDNEYLENDIVHVNYVN